MKLEGGDYLLLLSRTPDLKGHSVKVVSSNNEALKAWTWTTRSSHIFAANGHKPPNLASESAIFLYFLGPIDPGLVDVSAPVFLSLGIYNVLFFAETAAQQKEVSSFIRRFPKVPWEKWKIKSSLIQKITFGNLPASEPDVSSIIERALKVPPALAAADEENSTLLAASISKAAVYFPQNAAELEVFAKAFRSKFAIEKNRHSNDKLSWLVNVNAHLSRYTSQTFSGSSPITATECHFWSHSLLGIGVATQALIRIRRFVETAVGRIDWIDRLDALKDEHFDEFIRLNRNKTRFIERRPTALSDWLELDELTANIAVRLDENLDENNRLRQEDRLPLITCFSGRDGFRSTPFSLTAPLEVISGCNTYGWSLMTISHEICHVWMNGILGTIFNNLDDPVVADRLDDLFNGAAPRNVFEELQMSIYFCVDLLFREMNDLSMSEDIPSEKQRTWFEKIELVNLSLNEILTHVLDYQFFFQCNDEKYIRAIWSSWDVIPNIKDRLADYILRSACALLSERLNHIDAIDTTLIKLQTLLKAISDEHKGSRYLTEAVALLDTQRVRFASRLRNRALLVRLAKTFFTDSRLGKRLQHELQEPGGAYSSLHVKVFDTNQILNPLRFVLHYSTDRDIDKVKSVWILYKLAFAGEL